MLDVVNAFGKKLWRGAPYTVNTSSAFVSFSKDSLSCISCIVVVFCVIYFPLLSIDIRQPVLSILFNCCKLRSSDCVERLCGFLLIGLP